MKPKGDEPQSSTENDLDRFYCPYAGCNRSFAELWRLKVHYRAPPDIRGSGKERGHGTELTHCPKCGKTLKPGKHHVGCSAGRSAPRQATKRSRLSGSYSDGAPSSSAGVDSSAHPPPLPVLAHPMAPYPHVSHSYPAVVEGYPVIMPPAQPSYAYSQDQQVVYGVPAQQMPPHPWAPYQHPPLQHQQQQQQQPPTIDSSMQAPQHYSVAPAPNCPPAAAPAPPPLAVPQLEPSVSYPQHPMQMPHPAVDGPSLHAVFDYEEHSETRIPSPPPLPSDFHGHSGPLLFNFQQFTQKMPATTRKPVAPEASTSRSNSMKTEATDSSMDWNGSLGYDQTSDGDLLQILFGMPDDFPQMATIHLHQWDREKGANFADIASLQLSPGDSPPSPPPGPPPGMQPEVADNGDRGVVPFVSDLFSENDLLSLTSFDNLHTFGAQESYTQENHVDQHSLFDLMDPAVKPEADRAHPNGYSKQHINSLASNHKEVPTNS